MTLDFSALVTLLRRPRASSKATRATRSISRGRVDLGVDAAPAAAGQVLDEPRAGRNRPRRSARGRS